MPDWLRRYLQPREGWLAAGLLMVMLLSLSWSIQRAEWLEQAEFLVPVAFYAVLLGVIFGLSSLSVVVVLPISAVVGGAIVLWAVGGEYYPELSQGGRFLNLRGEAIDWTRILMDAGYAPQLTPYAILLGLLLWATAFIAAYTMYRHHRVLDAILLVGAALIANMSSTLADLFGYLVLFMLAALLLWLRAALIGREEGWQRRRVNENSEVPAAIMRTGLAFIATSIVMAWMLTSVAVAAPLTAVWNNLDTVWSDVRGQLDIIFGGLNNAESRFHGTNFGSDFSISGQWSARDDPVLTVAGGEGLYLRAVTYDIYNGHGWEQTPGRERDVEPDEALFPPGSSPEEPLVAEAITVKRVEIQIQRASGRILFTTGFPLKLSAPVTVEESADQPFLGAVSARTSIPPGSSYFLTAATVDATRTQLAAAGTDYPPEIVEHYLGVQGVTDRTRELAQDIAAQADGSDPYSRAQELADYFFANDEFAYNTTAQLPNDPNQDLVDYFLFDPEGGRVGFCQQYASAMVILARSLGIPARVAVGYAPGERLDTIRNAQTGRPTVVTQVRERNAHAWAELYFPGYGWQIFEATKSLRPISRRIGAPEQSGGSAGPTASIPPLIDRELDGDDALGSSQPIPGSVLPGQDPSEGDPRNGNILVVAGIISLLLLLAAWRWRQARRALRFLAPGDRQWRRLALAADRAGVSQRPSETIYEYAGWLEEQIPTRQPDIRTIADGKVWQSYSGHGISAAAIAAMESAWKRLELPLLWLAVRKRLRSLVPGR